jgi:hypothetical protein
VVTLGGETLLATGLIHELSGAVTYGIRSRVWVRLATFHAMTSSTSVKNWRSESSVGTSECHYLRALFQLTFRDDLEERAYANGVGAARAAGERDTPRKDPVSGTVYLMEAGQIEFAP